MMHKAAKHDWKVVDAEKGVTVRQITNRLRKNKFEMQRAGRTVILTDEEFNRYRTNRILPFGL